MQARIRQVMIGNMVYLYQQDVSLHLGSVDVWTGFIFCSGRWSRVCTHLSRTLM